MTEASKRTTSARVQTSPGCVPLKDAYSRAVEDVATSWDQAQELFLRAMEGFDANVVAGIADQGDIQNGKGDFFNDLLALLLENCAGVDLVSRGGVPGLIFPTHNLDITYPPTGTVEFMLEAKAVGIPKHPRNQMQKNPLGRPGSADLGKRIKEAAFKTIDLKAEYGRIQTQLGHAAAGAPGGGNLTTWLRSNKPTSYLFIAARVVDQRDQEAALSDARKASQVMDGVGLFMFRPVGPEEPTRYEPVPSQTHRDVDLAAVLYRACQDLASIQGVPTPEPRPNG